MVILCLSTVLVVGYTIPTCFTTGDYIDYKHAIIIKKIDYDYD